MNDAMTEGAPLVSVVMPAYNARHYIQDAICSLQEQTVKNWELQVVDDCSQDGTPQLLAQLAREDARIHPVYNEINRGAAASRNLALDRCTGEYIAFLDADDMWRPDQAGSPVGKSRSDRDRHYLLLLRHGGCIRPTVLSGLSGRGNDGSGCHAGVQRI